MGIDGSTHVILIYRERLEEYEKEKQKRCESKSENSNESKSDSKGWKHACYLLRLKSAERDWKNMKRKNKKYVNAKVKVQMKAKVIAKDGSMHVISLSTERDLDSMKSKSKNM